MAKLNHSRYLDYGARKTGKYAYEDAKHTPTHKQKKFYYQLYAMCKEHGVDTDIGFYTVSRADYALAIDRLIKRLQEKGVDIKGNNKNAGLLLIDTVEPDGSHYMAQRIVITDDVDENKNRVAVCRNCKHYYARNASADGGTCEKYEVFRNGALTCADWEDRENDTGVSENLRF